MAEILELPHLVEQHGVAQVQVGRGGVEAGLDPQRATELEAGLQLLALEDFIAAAGNQVEGMLQIRHGVLASGANVTAFVFREVKVTLNREIEKHSGIQ